MNLPERHSFEFFIDDTSYHDEPEIHSFYIERGDEVFAGRELLVKDIKIVYYIYPTGEHSGLLVFYLGDDCFDSIREVLDEDTIGPIGSAWPKFLEALSNGIHDNDSRYALAKCNFGSGVEFWAMYTRVENIELDDLNTEYIIGKAVQLHSFTIDMLNEMNDNEPSAWKVAANSAIRGAKNGIKWSRWISTALGVGGLFLGIDTSGVIGSED